MRETHGLAHRGQKRTSEHYAWAGMIARCYTVSNPKYKDYGARGITVCERWRGVNGLVNFLADMGNKPTPKHTIDRIEVNGNYEPSNCRWATQKVQQRNRRDNHILEYKGESKCMAEWAEHLDISQDIIESRINRYKWPVEKALTTPIRVNSRNSHLHNYLSNG